MLIYDSRKLFHKLELPKSHKAGVHWTASSQETVDHEGSEGAVVAQAVTRLQPQCRQASP